MRTLFLRLTDPGDKEARLRAAVQDVTVRNRRGFEIDPTVFRCVPNSPFAYWISDRLRSLFVDLPSFETNGREGKQGLSTAHDLRFVRLAWETEGDRTCTRWFPFAKGGAHSRYYADVFLKANWFDAGRETYVFNGIPVGLAGAPIRNPEHYFRPGLTWPRRTQGGLSLRVMPAGCIFADKGPAAFVTRDSSVKLLTILAISNSLAFAALVDLQMAFGSYEVGVIQRTPIPQTTPTDESNLAVFARRAWSMKRSLDTCTENAHAFVIPALLQVPAGTLVARAAAWADRVRTTDAELTGIQAAIDDRCFALYDINDEDRKAITESFGAAAAEPPTEAGPALVSSSGSEPAPSARPTDDDSDPDDSDESTTADVTALTADVLSWAIGVAFGRFDLRLATGERALPPEPDPFDPLPVCSPGMLTGADGLPCATSPSGYPIDIPQDGVLLDDPGHPRDLSASARAVFDVVFAGEADARWQEAAGILDPKNHDLRAFVARTFFEQHLKRYSKSRRKAPIYWQLATPFASYSVWLYAHRLTPDTFFHVLHDVVAPKLGLEERRLLSLTQESGPNPTASQRKEIAGQESFVDELRAFRDEVTRVAPLFQPDLDDGIVLTMAPLWRLVPQHRAWQKELKAAWDSLCAGEYDWAHVAMHLWPERVVPKCATDRSLAIAHGLEGVFWEEDAKGKWTARKKPVTPVATLVAERTSPAVKAALKDLLEAPAAGSTGGAGRRRSAKPGSRGRE